MPKLTVTFQYEASVEVDVSDAELAVLRRRHPQTDMAADCLSDTRKQVLSRAYEKEKELDARGSTDLMDTTVWDVDGETELFDR